MRYCVSDVASRPKPTRPARVHSGGEGEQTTRAGRTEVKSKVVEGADQEGEAAARTVVRAAVAGAAQSALVLAQQHTPAPAAGC